MRRSAKRTAEQQTNRRTAEQQKDRRTAEQRQDRQDAERRQSARQRQRTDGSKPVFKIQILVAQRHLKSGDHNFKGLKGCEPYEENGMVKYTYGASNNYNEIYSLYKEVTGKFPGAFIIAFKNGKKMDVNQGIREFKQNRNK